MKNWKREKTLVAAVIILGIAGVAYGMIEKNHPVFISGLCFVAGGYLLIRRKLKRPGVKSNDGSYSP